MVKKFARIIGFPYSDLNRAASKLAPNVDREALSDQMDLLITSIERDLASLPAEFEVVCSYLSPTIRDAEASAFQKAYAVALEALEQVKKVRLADSVRSSRMQVPNLHGG